MTQEKLKIGLFIASIISLLVVAYAAYSYAGTYADSIMVRSFSVTGEAKTNIVPDVAEFDFSVTTEGGKDLPSLQKQNTEKMNKIIAYLKEKKIEAKDITTTNYNLSPRYQYSRCDLSSSVSSVCPPPEIVGYSIRQSGTVKVRDFEILGGLLAGAVESGANGVSQLRFTIDDRDALLGEVKGEAIKKAQIKAKALAKAAGFRLGKLMSIEDSYNPYFEMARGYGGVADEISIAKAASSSIAPSPSIEPGSQEISAAVVLRYNIK